MENIFYPPTDLNKYENKVINAKDLRTGDRIRTTNGLGTVCSIHGIGTVLYFNIITGINFTETKIHMDRDISILRCSMKKILGEL